MGIQSQLWWLITALVIGSAIGIYYYLRIIFAMTMSSGMSVNDEGEDQKNVAQDVVVSSQDVLAMLLLTMVLLLGTWPQPFIEFAGRL